MNRALLLTLLLTSCLAQPKPGDVLFVDDFSNPDSGFNRTADADAVTEYTDGEYQIHVFAANLNVWGVSGPELTDTRAEVIARTAGGTENNLYGLICRYQDDSNFYFFAISADGYYAIGKLKEGEIVLLSSAVFEYSDKILIGAATNHLAVECAGESLSLAVNGAPLAQTADADFSNGHIGLIAGTFNDSETDIRFDNLLVTQP